MKSGALGEPRHFRSQRFLDWPETSWGWRQYKDKAGAGDLFDMTIHRIDFAIDLLGPIERVCGAVARFAPRDRRPDGTACPPSEVDDWSSLIGEFAIGGHRRLGGDDPGQGLRPRTASATSGPRSTARRARPSTGSTSRTRSCVGRTGHDLAPEAVPLRVPQAGLQPPRPRRGRAGHRLPLRPVWEFVSAIVEGRDAVPSFLDGLNAQLVADAVLRSHAERRWIDTPPAAP